MLEDDAVAHHADGDKRNNDPSNLRVLPSQPRQVVVENHNGALRTGKFLYLASTYCWVTSSNEPAPS